MYAVFMSGGKQYRVAVGDILKVETLPAEAGASIELDKVLMVADEAAVKVGSPYLADTTVTATVRSHGRGRKIRVFKMRRRKDSRKTIGHRQNFTELEITQIAGQGGKPKKVAKKAVKTDSGKAQAAGPKVKPKAKVAPKKKAVKKGGGKTA